MFKKMLTGKYQPHQVRFPTCCHQIISGYPAQLVAKADDIHLTAELPDPRNKLGTITPKIDCCDYVVEGLTDVAACVMGERGASKAYKQGVVIHGILTGTEMALQGVIEDYAGDFGDVEGLHFVGLYACPLENARAFKDTIDLGMRRADLMRAMMSAGWTNGSKDGPIWMMPLYSAQDEMGFMLQCDAWRDDKHPIYCTYSRKRFPDFGIYGGVAWDQTLPFHQQIYAKPTNDQIDNGIL